MLPYLVLVLATVGMVTQNTLSGVYNRKTENADPYVFTALIALSVAFIALCLNKFRFVFDKRILLYATLFGVAYSLCFVFQVFAVKRGGVALTSLILSYSLILPTLFGILVYHDRASVWFWVGLGALLVSIFLISGKSGKEERGKVTLLWVLFVSVAFAANGACSILQTHCQSVTDGAGKSEFMILAMGVVFAVNATAVALSNKKQVALSLKKGWYVGLLCGAANAVLNFSVMYLVGSRLNVSVVFPLLSVCGLLLTFAVSKIFFREKFTALQYAGFAVGIVSVILLNL